MRRTFWVLPVEACDTYMMPKGESSRRVTCPPATVRTGARPCLKQEGFWKTHAWEVRILFWPNASLRWAPASIRPRLSCTIDRGGGWEQSFGGSCAAGGARLAFSWLRPIVSSSPGISFGVRGRCAYCFCFYSSSACQAFSCFYQRV